MRDVETPVKPTKAVGKVCLVVEMIDLESSKSNDSEKMIENLVDEEKQQRRFDQYK